MSDSESTGVYESESSSRNKSPFVGRYNEIEFTDSTWKGNNWRKANRILSFISFVLIILAIIGGLGMFVVSFYGVILLHVNFFASSLLSYSLSPLYHSLSENWTHFAFSLLQVIVNCPFVQFYLLFIVACAKKFVDLAPDSVNALLAVYYSKIDGKIKGREPLKNYGNDCWDGDLCQIIGFLILTPIIWGLFWLTFWGSDFGIVPGMILYVIMVVPILLTIAPVYLSFVKLITKRELVSEEFTICMDQNCACLAKFVENLDLCFEGNNYNVHDQAAQTNDSALTGKYNVSPTLPDSSDSSVGLYSFSEQEKEELEEVEQKENEAWNNTIAFFRSILSLGRSEEYEEISTLGTALTEDHFHPYRNRIWLAIFLVMNIGVIGFDIYRVSKEHNGYFLFSIILRIIVLPITSHFHTFSVFLAWDKIQNMMFKGILLIGSVFTYAVAIGSIIAVACRPLYTKYQEIEKIDLPASFDISTTWNTNVFSGPFTGKVFNGLSVVDAVTLSLAMYDINRAEFFNDEMSHFFGEKWQDTIDYEAKWLTEQVPVGIFEFKDLDITVVALRGFRSGQELAVQIELFAIHYLIPYIEEIVPLRGLLESWWLEPYSIWSHNLGMHFFDPKVLLDDFMNPLLEIYNEGGLKEKEHVLFVGSNVGGVISKLAGLRTHRPAVAFISFPVFCDFLSRSYDLEDDLSVYITNVYNIGGTFTHPEDGLANNNAVPTVSTEFLEVDSIYNSFCTMAEMVGLGERYGPFCRAAVGEKGQEAIREAFKTGAFEPLEE